MVAEKGVQTVGGTLGRYDFGQAAILDTPHIEHTFLLRNDNKQPVEIDRLAPSCGCTSAFLAETPSSASKTEGQPADPATPHVVAPGQQIAVRVSVDVSRLYAGMIHKQVLVYGRGSFAPVATLEMSGKLQTPVTFSPPVLDFGRVQAGTRPQRTLTVSIDRRLLNRERRLSLVSSNPDIQITPVPGTDGSLTRAATPTDPSMAVQTYTIALSAHAAVGGLSGILSLARAPLTNDPGKTVSMPEEAALPVVLLNARVFVAGEIIGNIRADRRTVVFGAVPAGQQPTLDITLTGTQAALQGAHVQVDSTLLSAHFEDAPLSPANADRPATQQSEATSGNAADIALTRVLRVTLLAQRPGAVRTSLTVTTADGTRLVLPVVAYVAAK